MSQHRHFILYKPDGYLSQFIANGKVKQKHKYLGELFNFPEGTMAIGRLDYYSEGLLFLTTCGKTSNAIRGRHYEKEYYVQVDGMISDEAIRQLQEGVNIRLRTDDYYTLPSVIQRIPSPNLHPRKKRIRDNRHGESSWISITLTEGKYRQIRKMTAAVGFPTLRLVRIRIGDVRLNEMLPAAVIEVDKF